MKTKFSVILLIALFFCACGRFFYSVDQELAYEAEMRAKYVEEHPEELSEEFKTAILAGELVIGMTEEHVVVCLGRPYEINKSTGNWGTRSQWVYIDPSIYDFHISQKYAYVYFENGKVTSWQSD